MSCISALVAKKGTKKVLMHVLREHQESIDISVEDGASLSVVCINLASNRVEQNVRVGRNAVLHVQNVTFGDNVDHVLRSEVVGDGGTSSVDWVLCASGKDRQSITARHIFAAPHGKGEIAIFGIAAGHAWMSCDGVIEIGPHGGGTDTYLTEHMLMLDATARVRAVPSLKIETDDVRASHSATVSRICDEDLFYLGSRGISDGSARQILTEGFLGAIISRIGDENVRQRVVRELKKKLTIDLLGRGR